MAGHRDPRRSLIMYRRYGPPIIALAFLVILGVLILLYYGVVWALFPVVLCAAAILVLVYVLSQGGLRFVREIIYSIVEPIDTRPPPYQANQPYVVPDRTHPPQGYTPPLPGRCRYCGGQLYQGRPNCPHCGEMVHGPP